ncbi:MULTISPECIES: hypothetical protein [unclassified Paraburkholderia]|uniref:hypothetical protein n=1 Tax=unclassified Paraburkholderia TaxID=2615204 RepID=UPI002AB2CB16|nr:MULTISPECIES: hypothetical protein [unclassified Paraburkholderia]
MEGTVVYTRAIVSESPSSFDARFQYDSGWKDATLANINLVFDHGLGVTPTHLSVFFSPDHKTSYPLLWPWVAGQSGNPVSIWADADSITLSIYAGAPLHGAYNGQTASWTYWNSGFFRVLASQ